MAEFIYKSTVYGPQIFTVPDEGGIVEFKGKKLDSFGGYLSATSQKHALFATAISLEQAARLWWKKRNSHLDAYGHKANGIKP